MKRCLVILSILSLMFFHSCTKTEKTYYPDGNLQSIINYKAGKEHGKSVYMYDRPNTVEIEVEMRKGKRNGEFRRYFQNGFLDTYCVYENDSIEGVEIMYLANGTKTQETTYLHGKRHGPHTAYHINGAVKTEGNFKNDMIDGKWIYYDERGVLVGEGEFRDGAGTVTFYTPNGKLKQTTNYVNNLREGDEIYYNSDEKPYKIVTFSKERIVSQKVDSTLIY